MNRDPDRTDISRSACHLYLAGYRGSGKSSVGQLLATRLRRPWIDLDDAIESRVGRSIREIFASGGEAEFRDREEATLAAIASQPPAVISLGGGAVLRPNNRRLIADTGVCVWLQVDATTVLERLKRDASTAERRPALTGLPQREEIEKLLAERQPLYDQVARYRIDTVGREIDEIAQQTLAAIRADRAAPLPPSLISPDETPPA